MATIIRINSPMALTSKYSTGYRRWAIDIGTPLHMRMRNRRRLRASGKEARAAYRPLTGMLPQ